MELKLNILEFIIVLLLFFVLGCIVHYFIV